MPSVKLIEFDLINCKMKQEHTLEFQAVMSGMLRFIRINLLTNQRSRGLI